MDFISIENYSLSSIDYNSPGGCVKGFHFINIFFLLLLTGCSSTVDFQGSTNIFTGPEVPGKTFGFQAQSGFGNSTKFKLATLENKAIFSSQINVSTESGMVKDNNFNSQVGMGIAESFELYWRPMGDSPNPIGLKWQIFGSPSIKKEVGVKILVFGGQALESGEDNDSITATNGQGVSKTYNSNLKVSMREFGASIGYRLNPNLLFYLTPFYRQYKAKADLTSPTYPTVNINKNAIVRGAALGTTLTINIMFITAEAGYAHSQYSSIDQRDDYTLGGSFGFNFF